MKCILCGKEAKNLIEGVCEQCVKDYSFTQEQIPELPKSKVIKNIMKTEATNQKRNDSIKKEKEYSINIWITGLKLISMIVFCAIFVIGFYISDPYLKAHNYKMGLAILGGSLLSAFLSVALLMVFLNMAKDISEINQKLH